MRWALPGDRGAAGHYQYGRNNTTAQAVTKSREAALDCYCGRKELMYGSEWNSSKEAAYGAELYTSTGGCCSRDWRALRSNAETRSGPFFESTCGVPVVGRRSGRTAEAGGAGTGQASTCDLACMSNRTTDFLFSNLRDGTVQLGSCCPRHVWTSNTRW